MSLFGEILTQAEAERALDKCPICHLDVDHDAFRDKLSQLEYEKNGICQFCQDEIFDEHKTMTYRADGKPFHVKDGMIMDHPDPRWVYASFIEYRAQNPDVKITIY